MKNLFKTIIWMAVCAIHLSASTYQRNDAAIAEFANSLVNETPAKVIDILDTYFQYYPQHAGLIPNGVSGSIVMAPMAGETGDIDPTLTLLRMDPMQNWGISNAQYIFAITKMDDAMMENLRNAITEQASFLDKTLATLKLSENNVSALKNRVDNLEKLANSYAELTIKLTNTNANNALTITEMVDELKAVKSGFAGLI